MAFKLGRPARPARPTVESRGEDPQVTLRPSMRPDYTLVRVSGELDIATANDAANRLDALMDDAVPRLVLDLDELSFIDAFGIDNLLRVGEHAASLGGWLRLARVTDHTRRMLSILRLSDKLPAYPSVAAAAFGGSPSLGLGNRLPRG